MKITYIITRSDTVGGSHIHVRDLAKELQQEGHDVNIVIGGEGPVISHFQDAGLSVLSVASLKRNISPINDLISYFSIKKILKILKPDIVSTHSSKAGFIGRLAGSRLGIPVLFTAHGWSFTTGKSKHVRKVFSILEKLIVPKTNFFITVSDYDKILAQRILKISSKKIQTIHNGMKDINPEFRAFPGKPGVVSIVMVARFDQQKNQIELIEAVKDLKNFHIYFVGDGPKFSSVKKLTDKLELTNHVTFTGYSASVEKWLSEAHVFALISNWEGFPRSTIEAMRAGLPVVITNVGGADEAVSHGKNGFVIKKGDRESLKKYINMLIQDPNLRQRMGKYARLHYEDNLTFEYMYQKTLKIYKKIIGSSI